ncbi:uncharacterized protein At2g29880-like [Magnolia sinica]|uniref:uncharacterized protein At2g29880-like n=1 Tax=Magnolia sinica TaxID=86752 RepID=UPI00265945FE|nr:uncharacterized protein At2g29880-like [Magnolia sinica]
MDQVMIDVFLEQVALGRKGDNGFKREAYQIAADAVTKYTNVVLKWQNVSNRLRYYKREYTTVKDTPSVSGFGWDNEWMVVTAPDEVWEEYIKSHPRAEKLCGKRIERMDDLATIVGSDQASGHFVQGSRTIAASASSCRLQQELNDTWRELDDDLDDTIDLSDDFVTDSARTIPFSPDSPSIGQHDSRSTPTHTSNSNATQSGSAGRKRSRPARPCEVLGASLQTVADSMLKFGLGKLVNRTSKVLDILEEVQGLTNSEFFEVGQLLSKDKDLASFFVSLRPERRIDWLKKTLPDHFGDRGVRSI